MPRVLLYVFIEEQYSMQGSGIEHSTAVNDGDGYGQGLYRDEAGLYQYMSSFSGVEKPKIRFFSENDFPFLLHVG